MYSTPYTFLFGVMVGIMIGTVVMFAFLWL
jgi:hypothetical protein